VTKYFRVLPSLLLMLALTAAVRAQDKPRPEDTKIAAQSAKLVVTFSETAGDKKIVNLPYSLVVKTRGSSPSDSNSWGKIRVGERAPITVKEGETTFVDVGTNIDAQVMAEGDGQYTVVVNVERSSIDDRLPAQADSDKAQLKTESRAYGNPTIRQFKAQLTLLMKDGQTVQSVQAADPLDGRQLSITVTMNVVK
jgi:hypothetical protein